MNRQLTASALLLLGLSASAAADVCTTQSAGLVFFGSDPDSATAQSQASTECYNNAYATSTDCDANMYCAPDQALPYPSGVIDCGTQSQGQSFQSQGTDINQATSDAVSQCQGAASTDSGECVSGLVCYDSAAQPDPSDTPAPPVVTVEPYVYCATESQGYVFRSEGNGQENVSPVVVSACQANSATNNDECAANANCAATPDAVVIAVPPVQPPIIIAPPPPVVYVPRPPIVFPRPPVIIRPGRPVPPPPIVRPEPPRPEPVGPRPDPRPQPPAPPVPVPPAPRPEPPRPEPVTPPPAPRPEPPAPRPEPPAPRPEPPRPAPVAPPAPRPEPPAPRPEPPRPAPVAPPAPRPEPPRPAPAPSGGGHGPHHMTADSDEN